MAIPNHVRGALLEEIVLYLLALVGYRVVKPGEEGTKGGHAGLEVQGRGDWHQIDGLAAFDRTPAFMYPLRLLVEAKCYRKDRTVGIDIVRNSVGVLKDISENYFTHNLSTGHDQIQIPRYNYHAAVFSTSGYTKNAQRYALAHQIFLIQYENIAVLKPIIDALLGLEEEHFRRRVIGARTKELRNEFRNFLEVHGDVVDRDSLIFTEDGIDYVLENIVLPLINIRGSYFGVLQGRWPMHLLSNEQLPMDLFRRTDEIRGIIYRNGDGVWGFSPTGIEENEENWFRLEFDLPEEVAYLVERTRRDPVELLNVKQQHFSYIDLSGIIGGVQRQIRLRLDEQWAEQYLADLLARKRR